MGSIKDIKEINIRNQVYYFFDDMINIKYFGSNLLKTDKKSYKNMDIYYIGFITMKDCDYVKDCDLCDYFLQIKTKSIDKIHKTLE